MKRVILALFCLFIAVFSLSVVAYAEQVNFKVNVHTAEIMKETDPAVSTGLDFLIKVMDTTCEKRLSNNQELRFDFNCDIPQDNAKKLITSSLLNGAGQTYEIDPAYSGVIYEGAIKPDIKLITYYAPTGLSFTLQLTGTNKAGRKIIIVGDKYGDSSEIEIGRVDVIGFTDVDGRLKVPLTKNRTYKIYLVDSSNVKNLLGEGKLPGTGIWTITALADKADGSATVIAAPVETVTPVTSAPVNTVVATSTPSPVNLKINVFTNIYDKDVPATATYQHGNNYIVSILDTTCQSAKKNQPLRFDFSCDIPQDNTKKSIKRTLQNNAGTGDYGGDYTAVVYEGAIRPDIKLVTQAQNSHLESFTTQLTGSNKAGRKIIIMGETYYNEVNTGANFDNGRVDVMGYTDVDGRLRVALTKGRFHKAYIDSVSDANLIWAGYIQNDAQFADYYKVSFNTDQTASTKLVKIAIGGDSYHSSFSNYDMALRPVRVKDASGTVVCQTYSNEANQNIYTSPYAYAVCRVNANQKITIERNYWSDNDQSHWSNYPSDRRYNDPVYSGSLVEDVALVTNYNPLYVQELTVDLDGTDAANKKIIVKDLATINEAASDVNRIDAVGYTDNTGIAIFKLTQNRFYKVYLADASSEENLIWQGALADDDNVNGLFKNYHKVKYEFGKPSALISLKMSNYYNVFVPVTRPVRVKDAAGNIVCQGRTNVNVDLSEIKCRVNTGSKYTVERNAHDDNIESHWADLTASGKAYEGNVEGSVSILTGYHTAASWNGGSVGARKVNIDLGSSKAKQLITVYDISDHVSTAAEINANRIGCQGYTDANGVFSCEVRYARAIQVYAGDKTGLLLFNGGTDVYFQNHPITVKNNNLENSAQFILDDRLHNDGENADAERWTPVAIYMKQGNQFVLACQGLSPSYTAVDKKFSCLLEKGVNYYAFTQDSPNTDVNSGYWNLVYYGRVGSPDTLIRGTMSRPDLVGLIEVYVHQADSTDAVVNRKVEVVTDASGLVLCRGYTDEFGRVLCHASDYLSLPSTTSSPSHTVKVDGSVTNVKTTLYHSASYTTGGASIVLPSLVSGTPNYGVSNIGKTNLRLSYSKSDTTASARDIAFPKVEISVGQGSDLQRGILKVKLVKKSDESNPNSNEVGIASTEVTLYRAGTNTAGTSKNTDTNGQAIFDNIDSYYAYDVRTQYGEKANIYIQPGETTEVVLRKPSSSGSGEQLDVRTSRPSLLTLSGDLKNKESGNAISTASFKIKIKDKLEPIWYDVTTKEGFCFQNKVYNGEFGFIIGGQYPLFLVTDKVYTMDIDVYLSAACTGTASDTFTTYFKG